jgi:hypothetical protein
LLGIGAAIFLVGYAVYAFLLGSIDGMPLLPEGLEAGDVQSPNFVIAESDVDHKLKIAFGNNCPQLKRRYKFEVRKKGLVIAASDVKTEEADGRVKLVDFACAMFKEQSEGKWPEINTVVSDMAFLAFEQPIKNALDMNKSKLVGGELRGNINIVNNRGTQNKDDDLEISVTSEPLFYDDRAGHIWSDGLVSLIDKQTKPDPTTISGQGLDMLLVKEVAGDKKDTARKPRGENLNGVDTIVLKSTVRMDLYPDSSSGFMGSLTGPEKNDAKRSKKSGRSHVVITTEGQFLFDVVKDVAHFSSPPPKGNAAYPDQVQVLRHLLQDQPESKEASSYDQLLCDHLTLKFRRKAESAPPRGGTSGDREIESAHATARPGMDVVVSLDTENLAAYCCELLYECPIADRGARTTLRGEPLEAVKDGHKIKCRELMLQAADQKNVGQHVVAKGPGVVDLFDREHKGYMQHAIWKGLLTQAKFKDDQRDLDLLTLTEDAVFVDDEHKQKLWGQRLQVWLAPTETPAQAMPVEKDANDSAPRQQVEKVEAYERVKADGPEFRLQQADTLKIRFKDALPVAGVLPKPVPETPAPAPKPMQLPPSQPDKQSVNLKEAQPALRPDGTRTDKQQADKPKKPIDLWARDVVMDVVRNGDKNDLQELVAFGKVHVHQEGEKPEDKGVDIKGETLDLLHYVDGDGDILKVFGVKDGSPAELQLGELFLKGPQVTIDQRANTAAVEGVGLMNMPSNTNLTEGGKPAKAGTRITIHWSRNMFFDGQNADYYGGVTANQDDSSMQSNTLQVALDHRVSLKEGQRDGKEAKVAKVIAHAKSTVTGDLPVPTGDAGGKMVVTILDMQRDEKDKEKIVKVSRLTCNQVALDNLDNRINATGPGTATTMQYDTDESLGIDSPKGGKQAKPAPAKAPELMVTRVDYQDRLFSAPLSTSTTTRQSKFYGNILVVHVPSDNLDVKVDLAKLPPNGMMVQCQVLTVLSEQKPNQKTTQTMRAEKQVYCRSGSDMVARADIATFNQVTNTVIFEGTPGNPAAVYQLVGGQGGKWRETKAGKILYNRDNGTVEVQEGRVITTWVDPPLPQQLMVASRQ